MIDDKTLRDELQLKITQINSFPKSALFEVRDVLANKYNVSYGVSTDIFNGKNPIETLSYDMLYKLMTSIREVNMSRWGQLDASGLYAPKFFNEKEIAEFERPYENKKWESDLVIDNWLRVAPDYYSCTMHKNQIIDDLRNVNRVKYNPKMQRSLKVKVSKGVEVKVIRLNEKSLANIKYLMENNLFISDEITLNINPDMYEGVKENRNKLIISKDSVIDIIDGMHQYVSMCLVKDLYPDWDYTTKVNITMFDEEKANRYIIQKDKKNHLTDEDKVEKDKDSETNFVINKLNRSNNFYLRGKVQDKLFVINKIMAKLFDLDNDSSKKLDFTSRRSKSVDLASTIENNINYLIEYKDLLGEDFSYTMWFISLYTTWMCLEKNIEFNSVIEKLDFEYLNNNIKFKNLPLDSNYKFMKEAINNVL